MEIAIGIIAGLLAGFGTGFSGLSAAVFIAPMLIAFLNVESFTAVGIALASDVLASAFSAATYAKNKNIDLKRANILLASVITLTVIGSAVAFFLTEHLMSDNLMGYWLIIASLILGSKFLFFPGKTDKTDFIKLPLNHKVIALLAGIGIGFICGFQGTGGGLVMLFVLNMLLEFDFKTAVGTSVFIMSITALIGAVSHFIINGLPDTTLLTTCVIATLIGAEASALIANKINPRLLKRLTGILMTVSALSMLVVKIAEFET